MNTKNIYRKGDIFWVDLGENCKGSEQKGTRPCVVISNNIGNKFSTTLIISILSTQIHKAKLPTHVLLKRGDYKWLKKDSFIALEQVRTIDKSRLGDFIGRIDCEKFDKAIEISLGLKEVEKNNDTYRKAKNKLLEIEELNSCIDIMLKRGKSVDLISDIIDESIEKTMELEAYIEDNKILNLNYNPNILNNLININKMGKKMVC